MRRLEPGAWEHAELALIRKHYPTAGSAGTADALRAAGYDRTEKAIRVRASQMHVRMQVPSGKRAVKRLPEDRREHEIATRTTDSLRNIHRGCVRAIAEVRRDLEPPITAEALRIALDDLVGLLVRHAEVIDELLRRQGRT